MTRSRATRPPARPTLPKKGRIACVVSAYHADITGGMLESALATLAAAGFTRERVLVIEAPGTFELPLLAQAAARRRDVLAVLCFGLVLKGQTEHDRYIAAACAEGLMRVALDGGKPVLFGVLTCATHAQAAKRARRADEGGLDKGREVAEAALAALIALQNLGGRP
jgi:6,7-dimethyl-8-ribityllumazine synthase